MGRFNDKVLKNKLEENIEGEIGKEQTELQLDNCAQNIPTLYNN